MFLLRHLHRKNWTSCLIRINEREAAVSEEETEKVEEAVEQAGETAETVETETAKEAAKEVEAIESGNEDMNE